MRDLKANDKITVNLLLGLIWLGFLLAIYTWDESYFFWNQIRLAPSYALSLGAPLYGNLERDPLVWHLYGPFAPIFYYPAILTTNPLSALIVGICMSWGIILIGLWSCLRAWGTSLQKTITIVLFIFAFAFQFRIAWDLFRIMADLPAFGFGLLAMALAWREKAFWSGFCLLLSLASKQTMLPICGAVLWMLIRKKCSLREMFYGIGLAGLPLLIGLGVTGQMGPMIDSAILLPLRHPWIHQETGTSRLVIYTTEFFGKRLWLFIGFLMSFLFARRLNPTKEIPRIQFSSILGILFYVVAILQFCKVGGNTNAFFPGLILFYFIIIQWIMWIQQRLPVHQTLYQKGIFLAALILLIFVFVQGFLQMRMLRMKEPHYALVTYQNLVAQPGSRYEVFQPLVQMMAEKRVYHVADVLQTIALGKIPIPDENLRRWLPKSGVLIDLHHWQSINSGKSAD